MTDKLYRINESVVQRDVFFGAILSGGLVEVEPDAIAYESFFGGLVFKQGSMETGVTYALVRINYA